ncbi:MAG: helix-turn-helix domain-containing protein [Longimicrobiales bacterium]
MIKSEIAGLREDGVTRARLEEAWGVSRQRVSQVVGELERRGYLHKSDTRRRSNVYGLTGTDLIALGLATDVDSDA